MANQMATVGKTTRFEMAGDSEPALIGQIDLSGGEVDVTDPCYDDDVWCRLDAVKVKPGVYDCYASNYPGGSNRIKEIHIFHREELEGTGDLKPIGSIGVDAGLAGFFPKKKNYSDEEWQTLCGEMYEGDPECRGNVYFRDGGFFSHSGYGDGEYAVYAYRSENGEITGLLIEF